MGRFGSFVGPLVVGALVGRHLSVQTIFTAVAASILIGALACVLMARVAPDKAPASGLTTPR